MGALRAALLATPHHLLPHADLWFRARLYGSAALQLGMGENLEASKIVLVQFLDRIEQISVERHYLSALRHVDRSEEPCDGAAVGQCPTLWRGHPIGVVRTKRVAVGTVGVHEIVEPDRPVHVGEGHYGVGGRPTTGAADSHRSHARSRENPIQGPSVLRTLSGWPAQSSPEPSAPTTKTAGTPSTSSDSKTSGCRSQLISL